MRSNTARTPRSFINWRRNSAGFRSCQNNGCAPTLSTKLVGATAGGTPMPSASCLSTKLICGRARHGTLSTPLYVASCVDASPQAVKLVRALGRKLVRGHGSKIHATSLVSEAKETLRPPERLLGL